MDVVMVMPMMMTVTVTVTMIMILVAAGMWLVSLCHKILLGAFGVAVNHGCEIIALSPDSSPWPAKKSRCSRPRSRD